MKRFFSLSLFLVFAISSEAQYGNRREQFASDFWHEGKIILDTGDTLRAGQVKYNMQDDIIQWQAKQRLETFSARKVISFEIFDATVKRYRQFYSLPYAIKGQYKAPVFFELLQEGKMTLLCRESLELKTYSNYGFYGTYSRIVLVNKYFLLKEDGNILPFSGKKRDLIDLMGMKGEKVEDYIKEHKLNFDRKYDIAYVVEYYNSLF